MSAGRGVEWPRSLQFRHVRDVLSTPGWPLSIAGALAAANFDAVCSKENGERWIESWRVAFYPVGI